MRGALPWSLGALGTVLLTGGVGVFALATSPGADRTEYTGGYAPLVPEGSRAYQSELTLTFDNAVIWNRQHVLGAVLVVLGLLVLVGLTGWLLGRRAGPARAE